MGKKNTRNTKGRIIQAAWRLFYQQGYDDTTVDEIIRESGTSRGSFYHYFEGKDALLSSVSFLFDQKYEELMETIEVVRKRFGVTVLLIEHDMKLVSGICEYLYVLNFGRLLAEGTPKEVLSNPEVVKAYLGE